MPSEATPSGPTPESNRPAAPSRAAAAAAPPLACRPPCPCQPPVPAPVLPAWGGSQRGCEAKASGSTQSTDSIRAQSSVPGLDLSLKRERAAAHLDRRVRQPPKTLPPLLCRQGKRQAQLPAVDCSKPCRLCRPQQRRGVPKPARNGGRRVLPLRRLPVPLPLQPRLLLRPCYRPARVNGGRQLFKGTEERYRPVPLPDGSPARRRGAERGGTPQTPMQRWGRTCGGREAARQQGLGGRPAAGCMHGNCADGHTGQGSKPDVGKQAAVRNEGPSCQHARPTHIRPMQQVTASTLPSPNCASRSASACWHTTLVSPCRTARCSARPTNSTAVSVAYTVACGHTGMRSRGVWPNGVVGQGAAV